MSTAPDRTEVTDYDVAVVGAGISGTLAAITLGNAGYRVALIDRNAVFPDEFRVEKIGSDLVSRFERLGLLDAVEDVLDQTEVVHPANQRHLEAVVALGATDLGHDGARRP